MLQPVGWIRKIDHLLSVSTFAQLNTDITDFGLQNTGASIRAAIIVATVKAIVMPSNHTPCRK